MGMTNLLLALTLLLSMSLVIKASHIFMEQSKLSVRNDIKYMKSAEPTATHKIIFGVKQRNMDELVEVLHRVSDPDHPDYGKHWTKQEVVEFTRNPGSKEAVLNYLLQNNIKVVEETLNGEYITAEAPIHKWEKILNCKFHVYKLLDLSSSINEEDSTYTVVGTDSYSLPVELNEHVFAAFKTVQFPHRVSKRIQKPIQAIPAPAAEKNLRTEIEIESDSSPNYINWLEDGLYKGAVTPKLLQLYYDVPPVYIDSNISQGILESLDDALNPTDLTTFQQKFGLPVQGINRAPNGNVDPQACNPKKYSSCAESNLDVQYMMSLTPGTPTNYYYVDEGQGLDWLDFVITAANSADPDEVYSISYGTYELGLSSSVAAAFEAEVIKLGMMGSTVVASSGDDGVVGFLTRNSTTYCGYFPQYPASCPYVLAVGGTVGPENDRPEVACLASHSRASITTGGGFSTLYSAPKYQRDAVKKYFETVDNTRFAPYYDNTLLPFGNPAKNYRFRTGYYNRSRRGYPDVSVLAHNYLIYINGQQVGVDGTSASAPVMGALINIANHFRKTQGNSTLGWVNPLIYRRAKSFIRDITFGKNNCSAKVESTGYPVCCKHGFFSTEGWDPVTGLGSINSFRDFLASANVDISQVPTLAPTTRAPTPKPTGIPKDSPSNTSKLLANGIGIGIGGIIGLLILSAIFYYIITRCCYSKKQTAKVMSIIP